MAGTWPIPGKGNIDSFGLYSNGLKEGNWYVYTPKGTLLKELTYVQGVLKGKRDSTQVNEEVKKWRDSAYAGRTLIEIESEFPGGAAAWNQYLTHHMTYPQQAVNKMIQGIVIVQFIVGKDGHVDPVEVRINHSVEFSIDRKSIRMIRESPSWTPASRMGNRSSHIRNSHSRLS